MIGKAKPHRRASSDGITRHRWNFQPRGTAVNKIIAYLVKRVKSEPLTNNRWRFGVGRFIACQGYNRVR